MRKLTMLIVMLGSFMPGFIFASANSSQNSLNNGMLLETPNLFTGADSIDCQAAFIFEVDDETLTVSFFDESLGNNLEYIWGFDDGTTSTEANPVHTYSEPGVYTVLLNIFSQDPECVSVAVEQVEVGEIPCVAMFDYYQWDFTVYFGDESQGNPTSWFWDFGDGNTSTEQNPAHTFTSGGPFDVMLAISGDENCSDTVMQTITFDTTSCFAYFEYSMDDLTVSFGNLSVGLELEHLWEFGDGITSAEENPVHTYTEPGIYGVCLLITDIATGCESSYCYDIEVGDIPCEANFNYFALGDSLGINSVYFSNLSTGNFTTTYWDFGDGNSSTQYSPIHTYDEQGEYEVCLTISDPGNTECNDQYCATLIIDSIPCSADFTYEVNNLTVNFSNLSTGSDPYMYWYFGDGNSSFEIDPEHTYASAGYYEVCLAIYDEIQFCYDYFCTQIVVGDLECEADFSYFQSAENAVQFIDQSNVPADSLIWDFGDGTISGDINPEHVYDEFGTYTVCLTIYNELLACEDQLCREVMIDEPDCTAEFAFDIDELTVAFAPEFEGDSILYIWEFGDGNSAQVQNPVHTYDAGGMYDVCLVVIDPLTGCTSTFCEFVLVGEGQNLLFASWFSYEFETESEVQFIEGSLGNAVNYFWEFDDGITSTMQHPMHNFSQTGMHNVCLTVSDMFTGETSTFCREIEIVTLTNISEPGITENQLQIFPNPATTAINITCSDCAIGSTLEMYNLNGQKILETQLNQQNETIDIRDFENGVYLVKVIGDRSLSTKRLIKN